MNFLTPTPEFLNSFFSRLKASPSSRFSHPWRHGKLRQARVSSWCFAINQTVKTAHGVPRLVSPRSTYRTWKPTGRQPEVTGRWVRQRCCFTDEMIFKQGAPWVMRYQTPKQSPHSLTSPGRAPARVWLANAALCQMTSLLWLGGQIWIQLFLAGARVFLSSRALTENQWLGSFFSPPVTYFNCCSWALMFLCELCVQPETRQGGQQLGSCFMKKKRKKEKHAARLHREKSVNNCFSKRGSLSVFEVLGCCTGP